MSDQLQVKSYRPATEFGFPIPPGLQAEVGGYSKMVLRELLPSMEARAISAAGTDPAMLQQTLVKLSLVKAVRTDGTVLALDPSDESVDRFLAEIGPKGRALLTMAYSHISNPRKDELDFFLQGVEASTK
jgi:hypothetical protein